MQKELEPGSPCKGGVLQIAGRSTAPREPTASEAQILSVYLKAVHLSFYDVTESREKCRRGLCTPVKVWVTEVS